MEVAALKQHIKSGELLDFYVFIGDEWAVQDIYIKQIAKAKKCNIKRINAFADIYQTLKARSFVQNSAVYVLRDDKDILTLDKVQNALKAGILGDNTLILLLINTDKRTKFYKAFKERFVEFEPLAEPVLIKYIQREIDLSEKECSKLIELCESNYGRILLEIDKLKRLGESFDEAVKEGVIYRPPKDAIFDFVDAVMKGYTNISFELYEDCKSVGESSLVILSVLYNNIKQTLQVQSYEGNDVAKATGLQPWLINKIKKEYINVYTDTELVEAMRHIREWERGIKLGYRDEQFAVPAVLEKLF